MWAMEDSDVLSNRICFRFPDIQQGLYELELAEEYLLSF